MAATQEYVNTRVYLVEQKVAELAEEIENLELQLTTQDADLAAAEKR